jgi:protein O-GlcNAc transferase
MISATATGCMTDSPVSTFARLRLLLALYQENPSSVQSWRDLLEALRNTAGIIARLPRKETDSLIVEDARQLVREIAGSGILDRKAEAEDLALAQSLGAKGWQGLLAGMLLVSAWQWPNAPLVVTVPDWLRADYVTWLFAAPQGFTETGQAEVYAAYTLQRLEELVRWMNRSPGASAEADVLGAYAKSASVIPLYFCTDDLRKHAELRARLLQRAVAIPGDIFDATPASRVGRRLRVGIVNRHFGSQTETYTTLPTFEELDPERFEVILFCHRSGESDVETYARAHAADSFVLPEDLEGQLSMLRAAALDVAVFGTNVTAVCNEVTRIALHRVAPLQVVNNSSCITSGLPEIDLYVSGTLTEAPDASEHFTERLGLLPGPAHAFNYHADRQEPQVPCSRGDFSIPADAFLYVSAANYYKIIPEMQQAWARLLAAVPGSHLLIHPFNQNWSSNYPIARFRAGLDGVLAKYGVEASRLSISSMHFPSRTDVKTLLGLGDAYLDTFPFGGVNSLVDPLELGLPVIAWEGETFRSRMGAAMLRTLELPELVATSDAEYHAIAVKLAADVNYRKDICARISGKMEEGPIFLDSLAASEAFGDLIERAFDDIVDVGQAPFRANRTPLVATVSPRVESVNVAPDALARAQATLRAFPSDASARHQVGRSLLEAGRTQRAVTYLLAALQSKESKAELWLDVARALKADGQLGEALQALEAGLKIDQTLLEGWVLFAELAHTLGSAEIAREAAGVARQLAPADDRVVAYL